MDSDIQITINANPFHTTKDSSVSEALNAFKAKEPYALLLNETFLPKSQHADTLLKNGDKLEVISAIQGG